MAKNPAILKPKPETPIQVILKNESAELVTALTEVTFRKGTSNEQVVWRSFLPLYYDHFQIESRARQSLRLGKKTWQVKSIDRWSLRGW